MIAVSPEETKKQNEKNEFESYLQTRRENTTYNGIELESSNWHKEMFGFKSDKD